MDFKSSVKFSSSSFSDAITQKSMFFFVKNRDFYGKFSEIYEKSSNFSGFEILSEMEISNLGGQVSNISIWNYYSPGFFYMWTYVPPPWKSIVFTYNLQDFWIDLETYWTSNEGSWYTSKCSSNTKNQKFSWFSIDFPLILMHFSVWHHQ